MGSRRTCHCKYEPKIHTTLALFLMLMGCLLFAIFATRAIPSYVGTKNWRETTCTVEASYLTVNVCCDASVTSADACAEGYTYPCAKAQVTYYIDDQNQTALIFDRYHSLKYASRVEECSYFHCFAASYDKHVSNAEDFLEQYGKSGDEHPCYYDPDHLEHAVLDITSSTDLLHALLWPLLLIVLSTIIFLIVVIIRKKRLDPLDEDDDDDSSEDTTSHKSEDATKALTATGSRSSSEASMLTPPQREEVPPTSPEKWAVDSTPKSRGSSARPATRSAIHCDVETPLDGKKTKPQNTKKNGHKKDSKGGLNLTPVNA